MHLLPACLPPLPAELEGLLRKLTGLLAPPADSMRPDWRVSELLGTWWRWVGTTLVAPSCVALRF